jgi:thiol-disulfide isomerase/thioredoxin
MAFGRRADAPAEIKRDSAMAAFDATTLTVLDPDEQEASASTVGALRDGKPLVLDFWTTRCVRCPAALSHLDEVAPKHPGVTFASCAMSLNSATEGTQEQVLELLEGQWENLKHCYMTFDEKEAAKAAFGFSSVPFCVVFGADGAVHYKGDPKDIDYATVFDAKPASSAEPAPPTPSKALASALEKTAVTASEPPAVPLGESNRTPAAPVALGFGNDDEDF